MDRVVVDGGAPPQAPPPQWATAVDPDVQLCHTQPPAAFDPAPPVPSWFPNAPVPAIWPAAGTDTGALTAPLPVTYADIHAALEAAPPFLATAPRWVALFPLCAADALGVAMLA